MGGRALKCVSGPGPLPPTINPPAPIGASGVVAGWVLGGLRGATPLKRLSWARREGNCPPLGVVLGPGPIGTNRSQGQPPPPHECPGLGLEARL